MEALMQKAIGGLDCDYSEIRMESGEITSIVYMGKDLETIGSSFVTGGCVRVAYKGGWGFSAFNSPDEAGKSAAEARNMAVLAAGEKTELAPVEIVRTKIPCFYNVDPSTISLEEKKELLGKYNTLMLSENGIITTRSIYRDIKKNVSLLTSEGTFIEQEKSYCGVSLMAVAREGSNIQRGIRSYGDMRGYETALNRESAVLEAAKTARDILNAPKVEGGIYTVVLDPQLAGVFVHEAFGHLSEADFIYENPNAREMMKMGRRFGPDFLNIIDDGSIPGENGYVGYDDEGVKKGASWLIKNGVLNSRLHSRETAARMGEKPTGNARAISFEHRPIVRMTSTFIDKGESSRESIFEGIENGIYACGFLGGMTDLERFTFSSASAFMIENGKITTPVRDVILSGNVFQTMHNITMIGDDIELFGGLGGCGKGGQSPLPVSDGSPHIRIKDVLVG